MGDGQGVMLNEAYAYEQSYEESEDPLSESSPSHSIYWYSYGVASRAAKCQRLKISGTEDVLATR